MSIQGWIKSNTRSLAGKKVAVSGATGGIGRQLCEHLASLDAQLILVDRNMQRSGALRESLADKYPSLSVSHIQVDLEDMDAVKSAAERLMELEIDYLILNAGAYHIPRHKCKSGYDNVFQINFVSPYYLSKTLAPSIRSRGGKIVAVGSIAHNYSRIDERDIDFSTRNKSSKVYGNAKRYLMFSLFEPQLADCVSVTHPGITLTGITAHYPKLIFAIIKYPMKVIFMRPRKAALCALYGLFADVESGCWIGPRIFGVWGLPKIKRLSTCSEDEACRIRHIAKSIYERL